MVAWLGEFYNPCEGFVRVVFGETLDVVVGSGVGTLDIACAGHYILYVVCIGSC